MWLAALMAWTQSNPVEFGMPHWHFTIWLFDWWVSSLQSRESAPGTNRRPHGIHRLVMLLAGNETLNDWRREFVTANSLVSVAEDSTKEQTNKWALRALFCISSRAYHQCSTTWASNVIVTSLVDPLLYQAIQHDEKMNRRKTFEWFNTSTKRFRQITGRRTIAYSYQQDSQLIEYSIDQRSSDEEQSLINRTHNRSSIQLTSAQVTNNQSMISRPFAFRWRMQSFSQSENEDHMIVCIVQLID